MDENPFFCECCQIKFGMGGQVMLDDGRVLPICEMCWNQVPIGDRLKFLAEVRRNQTMEAAIDAVVAWYADQDRSRDPFGRN